MKNEKLKNVLAVAVTMRQYGIFVLCLIEIVKTSKSLKINLFVYKLRYLTEVKQVRPAYLSRVEIRFTLDNINLANFLLQFELCFNSIL